MKDKILDEKLFRDYREVYLRLMRYWLQEYFNGDPKAVKYINQLKKDYEKLKTKIHQSSQEQQNQKSVSDKKENREGGNQKNN